MIVVPPAPYRPSVLRWQVFRGADAVRQGLLTAHQLRSRAWIRLRQDVYADARLERDHGLVCRATLLRVPKGMVIAGPSAAWSHGIDFAADFTDDVHVIAPTSVRISTIRGVRAHAFDLTDDEIVAGADLPHTSVARTAWDVAAWLPPARAVSILDAMLNRDLLTRKDLDDLIAAHPGRRGRRHCRTAFAMADSASAEPLGSQLRARLILAGIPAPVLQPPISSGHGLVLSPDMGWPLYRVAVEYQTHRLALLTAAGWLAVHVPPARVRRDFPTVLREVRQSLNRRGWSKPERP